jgi:virulence factor Mce-like protein
MNRSPRSASVVANPVLVGAVTVLVTAVAVWLAYNANHGLPFVPTVRVDVRMQNGANLIKGSEVRENGYRVGVVEAMRPVQLGNGRVGAEAVLRLDQRTGHLPADSRFVIRARGAIGSKYLDIRRGRSRRLLADGANVPAARTSTGVDLDEALSTFDAPTRRGVRGTLLGLGNGLAGRGADVNETVARLPRLLAYAAPVMANLAAAQTDLDGFVRATARATGALAPVAGTQAGLFTTMADTFAALSRDERALEDVLREAPRTLSSSTRSLRRTRPVLRHAAALARRLEPTTVSLRRALPDLNRGLEPVPRALEETVPLAGDARGLLDAVRTLTSDPATNVALRGLTATATTLLPQARFYGPAFTVCRHPQLWLQFVPDVLDTPDPTGLAQRGIVATTDFTQHDDLSTMGANEWVTARGPVTGAPQHLHADTYPYFVDEQGNADCLIAAGGYRWGWNPHDTTPDRFYRRVVAEHFPASGRAGAPWTRFDRLGNATGERGPDRVPPGQTFTRDPGGRAAPKAP